MQHTSIRPVGAQVVHHEGSPSPRQAAYLAGEQAITGRATAVLLGYYKYLVKISGFADYLPSQETLARKFEVSDRTIRNYDVRLIELGLIWTERRGHGLRRHIMLLDPPFTDEPRPEIEPEIEPQIEADPEVVVTPLAPVCKEPFVASKPEGSIRLNRKETSGSSFKGDQIVNQGGLTPLPPKGGGGGYGYPREFIPDTPATEILQREGVQSWRSLQLLADKPVAEISAALTAIKSRRNVETVPGLLVYVLTGKRGLFLPTKEGVWADSGGDGGSADEEDPDCPVCDRKIGECHGIHLNMDSWLVSEPPGVTSALGGD